MELTFAKRIIHLSLSIFFWEDFKVWQIFRSLRPQNLGFFSKTQDIAMKFGMMNLQTFIRKCCVIKILKSAWQPSEKSTGKFANFCKSHYSPVLDDHKMWTTLPYKSMTKEEFPVFKLLKSRLVKAVQLIKGHNKSITLKLFKL